MSIFCEGLTAPLHIPQPQGPYSDSILKSRIDKMNNHKNNSKINVPTEENELLRSSELY
jgi:hypothetical protein